MDFLVYPPIFQTDQEGKHKITPLCQIFKSPINVISFVWFIYHTCGCLYVFPCSWDFLGGWKMVLGSAGNKVTDVYSLPHGFWELNLVLLTTKSSF